MTIGPGERYRLDAVLGQGGAARVHRAHDTVLGRDVAIKVLLDVTVAEPSATGESPETARARFTAEARTLASLDHPHLVTLLDAGFDDQHPFLVMSLVEGPTLAAAIAGSGGGLERPRVARIGAQIASALAYTHERGVVHRDVKPGNILLARGPEDHLHAALADFGIARLLDSDDAERNTRTGLTIGTAAYLAPEQVRGEAVGPAADVYALGLVLLESLTGERTYRGTPVEAAVARLTSRPAVPDGLPAAWRDLLTAMTELDPALRPSAAEVASRTAAIEADAPTEPEPTLDRTAAMAAPTALLRHDAAVVPTREAEDDRGSRRSLLLVLGAAAAVVVVLALGVQLFGGSGAKDSPQPAADTPSSSPSGSPSPAISTSPTPTPAPSPSATATPVSSTGSGPGKAGPGKAGPGKAGPGKGPGKAGKPPGKGKKGP